MDEVGKTDVTATDNDKPEKGNRTLRRIKLFLKRTLDIREGVDVEATTEGIKRDISFRGQSVWILGSSIFIASIGLNLNSAPAIIGAMLISPLMGPILGLGLSIGTYDFDLLLKSLKHIAIAILVSLSVSTLYFALTPFKEAQSELLARTQPTTMDVLIAFFGGVAGIVAGSRREKTNVIPGVAIATALMPPLCTAGYGLATGQFAYFFGAFYLFIINCVFISRSIFWVVRYRKFPQGRWVDAVKEKRYRTYIFAAIVVTILPSGYLTYRIFQESSMQVKENNFYKTSQMFLDENFNFEGSDLVSSKFVFNDSANRIELFIMGQQITEDDLAQLNARLANYSLENTSVKILQEQDVEGNYSSTELLAQLENSYKRNEEIAQNKDEEILQLRKELEYYKKYNINVAAFRDELRVEYEEIERFSFANAYEANKDGMLDTIPTFWIDWNGKTPSSDIKKRETKLYAWLKVKFKMDTIRVMRY
ncbi:TIGR00341 family protein [soil metagenome]